MLEVCVVKVVDGDTIKVEIEAYPEGFSRLGTVRLIGLDTPEVVAEGFAGVEYPLLFMEESRRAESAARLAKKMLWGE